MFCNKCGNELPDGSIFCNKCGKKQVTDSNNDFFSKLRKIKRELMLFGLVGILLIGTIITVVIVLNNPVKKFKGAIEGNQYEAASKIYVDKIKGNTNKEEEINNYLSSEIEIIKKDFNQNNIEYNTAITKLETIQKSKIKQSGASSAIIYINKLNDSRTAFKAGNEFLNNKNYKNALIEFKKVLEEDENYNMAQELINNSIKDYKALIIRDAEVEAQKSEYEKAILLLSAALTVIPNDPDISAKKVSYENLNGEKKAVERKERMEGLENNQEVSVVSAKVFKDWIEWDQIEVIVKNNTDKVVKQYTVGWMCYDKEGYPIKTGYGGEDYLDKGKAERNIQPGKTFGSGYGWDTSRDTNAKTVLACVIEAEYYDGTTWSNPYYDYWLEEYKEKPLH